MKELVKRFSALAALAGIFMWFSPHSFAETTLDHSGKIRLQSDRIGQDETQRENSETQDQHETELEKTAPDLFKEQTRAAIKTKQIEIEQTTKEVEKGLFVTPDASYSTVENTEKDLFSSNYTVRSTVAASENMNGQDQDGSMSSKTWTAILGFIVVGCGGLFTMMRKMLE